MWYQVLIPSPFIIIPILIMTTRCQSPKNDSDVIVINSNHAEAVATDNNNADATIINNAEQINTKNDGQNNNTLNNGAKEDNNNLDLNKKLNYARLDNIGNNELNNDARRNRGPSEFNNNAKDHNTGIRFNSNAGANKFDVNHESSKEEAIPSSKEDIVFIPNERDVVRNEDYLVNDHLTYDDLIMKKTVDDVLKGHVNVETEPPNGDIIFVSGKNNENIEKDNKKEKQNDSKRGVKETGVKLDCKNLDCNNTIGSVCGGKLERNHWSYRLFLNECFFRKVNCYFRKKENRYQEVSLDKCKNIGYHHTERPFVYNLNPNFNYYQQPPRGDLLRRPKPTETIVKVNHNTRRQNLRRSMTRGVDGRVCDHVCPVHCTEDYEPECAVSSTGKRRVFLNHCKLDFNSCAFGIVWRRRPLSECVGGKKADMRQNRGFINWMQSVGIVDKKGRLVLT